MDFLLGGEGRRTAHEMVRETLRRAILDGSLPPGVRLVQADIAEQLSVSTTPVREALRDLATEGLIHIDAHRGAVVHQTSLDELREIYDMRRLLEPEAVRRAVKALSAAELDQLAELHERMSAESDSVRWVEMNRAFHRMIVGAAGSKRLIDVLHRLEDAAAMYVGVVMRSAEEHLGPANHQHGAILAACQERDAERAAEVIAQHLDDTLSLVERRSEDVARSMAGAFDGET